jgi:hypothetical protein
MQEQKALELFNMILEQAKSLYKKDGYLEPVLFLLKDNHMTLVSLVDVMADNETKEKGAILIQQIVNRIIPDLIIMVGEARIQFFDSEKKKWETYENGAYATLEFIDDSGEVQSYSCMMVLDPENKRIIRENMKKCDKAEGKFCFLANMKEFLSKFSTTDVQ